MARATITIYCAASLPLPAHPHGLADAILDIMIASASQYRRIRLPLRFHLIFVAKMSARDDAFISFDDISRPIFL